MHILLTLCYFLKIKNYKIFNIKMSNYENDNEIDFKELEQKTTCVKW